MSSGREGKISVKRAAVVLGVVATVVAVVTGSAAGASSNVTVTQLKSGFKKATGQTLVVDRARSSAGHYTGFNLGVQTAIRQARYGTFTIFLVTGSDVTGDMQRLLMDPHTGQPGTPGAGGIIWEKNVTLTGTPTWTAKRPYGSNVVIWWTTASPAKKTDKTWTTLHKALTAVTKGG